MYNMLCFLPSPRAWRSRSRSGCRWGGRGRGPGSCRWEREEESTTATTPTTCRPNTEKEPTTATTSTTCRPNTEEDTIITCRPDRDHWLQKAARGLIKYWCHFLIEVGSQCQSTASAFRVLVLLMVELDDEVVGGDRSSPVWPLTLHCHCP